MLNAIVIENETAGADKLAKHYANMVPDLCVKAKLKSVKESIQFFSEDQDADIIFSDVQLIDGFSFDIFTKTNIHIPIIFITPENNFMITKIGINAHNYLSTPDNNKESGKTNLKIHELQKILLNNIRQERKKTRLLVKRGVANIALLLNDIAAIYTKNKLVYVIDSNSKKYSIDKTLTELEEELNKNIFFRANRQYVININFVRSFKAYKKVKLLVDIDIPELEEPVIISQHVAPAFKKWMEDA